MLAGLRADGAHLGVACLLLGLGFELARPVGYVARKRFSREARLRSLLKSFFFAHASSAFSLAAARARAIRRGGLFGRWET